MYPPLGQAAALEVEVGQQDMNTSVMARLEVEAHPLPYFSDVIWTIVSPGERSRSVQVLLCTLKDIIVTYHSLL